VKQVSGIFFNCYGPCLFSPELSVSSAAIWWALEARTHENCGTVKGIRTGNDKRHWVGVTTENSFRTLKNAAYENIHVVSFPLARRLGFANLSPKQLTALSSKPLSSIQFTPLLLRWSSDSGYQLVTTDWSLVRHRCCVSFVANVTLKRSAEIKP
jgi:hypothetical protein